MEMLSMATEKWHENGSVVHMYRLKRAFGVSLFCFIQKKKRKRMKMFFFHSIFFFHLFSFHQNTTSNLKIFNLAACTYQMRGAKKKREAVLVPLIEYAVCGKKYVWWVSV